MLHYIVRRLLLMVPTLLGVTAVVFFVMAMAPGGVGGPALSEEGAMDANQRRAMREYYQQRYGLDQPLIVQYGKWLNRVSPLGWRYDDQGQSAGFGIKMPDLGHSLAKRRPVTELLVEALPITLLLNLLSIPLIYLFSIWVGVWAARHAGGWFDSASGLSLLFLYSVPENFAGVLLIGFLAGHDYWPIFPASGLHSLSAERMAFYPSFASGGFQAGWLLDTCGHLVLPLICMTYGGFAFLTKLARGSVLDNLRADYVRTAIAKGLDDRTSLFRHVLSNSLLPLITVAAGIIPGLIGGAVVIETMFSIPGMGKLAVDATFARDRELILAISLIGGFLGLLSQLVCDLAYAWADPRVSYE